MYYSLSHIPQKGVLLIITYIKYNGSACQYPWSHLIGVVKIQVERTHLSGLVHKYRTVVLGGLAYVS